jgi:hypothetical protein
MPGLVSKQTSIPAQTCRLFVIGDIRSNVGADIAAARPSGDLAANRHSSLRGRRRETP